MNIEEFRTFCLHLPATTESCPFGPETLVFKVKGKMFALCSITNFESINLKCDPEKAIELRETYNQIKPGFHMNKKHWNTVHLDGLPQQLVEEMINASYQLVVSSLTKALKKEIDLGI